MTKLQKPATMWLLVDEIKLDPVVQRDLNHRWVKYLTDNWDDAKLGIVEVSHREGDGYYVTDGQHRLAALKALDRGGDRIPVLVKRHESLQDEARDFVAKNVETRKPNPVDNYRIQLVAGDPEILEIDEVIRNHGLVVRMDAAENSISAVAALRWLYKRGGPKLIDQVLYVTRHAWGHDRNAVHSALLRGLGYLIERKADQLSLDHLAEKLAKDITPPRLVGRGRQLAEAWAKGHYLGVADAVVGIYNRGMKKNRIELP